MVDSRTSGWVKKGIISGAINLPWAKLNPARGADPVSILEILEEKFGYPAPKIKWYRGGTQVWEVLGPTTVPGGE